MWMDTFTAPEALDAFAAALTGGVLVGLFVLAFTAWRL